MKAKEMEREIELLRRELDVLRREIDILKAKPSITYVPYPQPQYPPWYPTYPWYYYQPVYTSGGTQVVSVWGTSATTTDSPCPVTATMAYLDPNAQWDYTAGGHG